MFSAIAIVVLSAAGIAGIVLDVFFNHTRPPPFLRREHKQVKYGQFLLVSFSWTALLLAVVLAIAGWTALPLAIGGMTGVTVSSVVIWMVQKARMSHRPQ
ncbi:MAG: hypothetical protein N3A02_05535 [Rectinema sp.]|nr:hypothetical protein [Rectinema sp.]